MKKIITLFSGILISTLAQAQNGQLNNGGFENWTNAAIYDYTTVWGCSNIDEYRGVPTTAKVTTGAYAGNYSVLLTAEEVGANPDTTFGYVFHGVVGESGPESGISYGTDFDEVRFRYKCDFAGDDSLFLLVIRFDAMDNPTGMFLLPAAGGSYNTWTAGSVDVPAGTQAKLFLGFIVGNPFASPRTTPGNWAQIDDVHMYLSNMEVANVPDPSFESWATMTTEVPDNWYTMNEMLAGIGMENVVKSTNASSGLYAAEISTIEYPAVDGDTIQGWVSWGPVNFNSWMNPFIPIPYTATPSQFSGMYQYSYTDVDEGTLSIMFYKNGSIIGGGNYTFTPTMGYSPFSIPFMWGMDTPDSIVVVALSGEKPGSVLHLDQLMFSGGNVSLEEFAVSMVNVYPNPATDVVMIKTEGVYTYEVIDLTGKVLMYAENVNGAQSLNISGLAPGKYILKLLNQQGQEMHSFVKE